MEKAGHVKYTLKEFETILDEIVPQYGTPQSNLEGSEPTNGKRFTAIY